LSAHVVIAQHIKRAGSSAFLFALPIKLALKLLEIPDPANPFPDNRRVSKKHAMDFGNYWERHQKDWIIPPLLLDSSRKLKFEIFSNTKVDNGLVELELESGDRGALRILDGQHRILGWYLKQLELDSRLSDATSAYNRLVISGAKREAELMFEEIDHIRDVSKRLDDEHVAVNLLDLLTSQLHQQFFVDIARNSLGINKTVQAKFDASSIINRVAQTLIKNHNLFKERIDLEKTSCSGSNPNLLTVVNVSDITRHVCFGVNRKVTSKRENNYKDEDLIENVTVFLDSMVKHIPQLQQIIDGKLKPKIFREKYMLGSGTIWRCLAGAFYESCVIIDDDQGTIEIDRTQLRKFEKFLGQFADDMYLPISREWFATTLFPIKRSKAPSSRAQDLESMVGLMSAWTRNGRMFFPKTPNGLQV
jgi:hypothetical protein